MSTDVHFSTIICQCFLDACVHLCPKEFAQAQATRKLAHTHAHAPARARTNSMHARICCLFDDPGMRDANRKSAQRPEGDQGAAGCLPCCQDCQGSGKATLHLNIFLEFLFLKKILEITLRV